MKLKHEQFCQILAFSGLAAILSLLNQNAFGQGGNDTGSGDNQFTIPNILGTIGISSAVGGGISALVNMLIDSYRSKKNRQLEDANSRYALYREIIYHIERMLFSKRFQTGNEGDHEIEDTFKIIHELMKSNYLLVDQEINDEWRNVSANWRESYRKNRRDFAISVIKLRDLLVSNYNMGIRLQEELLGTFRQTSCK